MNKKSPQKTTKPRDAEAASNHKKQALLAIEVPNLGESITEATLARWCVEEGQHVERDTILAELETDKITLEITAPETGLLQKKHVDFETTVKVGQKVADFLPQHESSKTLSTRPSKDSKDSPDALLHNGEPIVEDNHTKEVRRKNPESITASDSVPNTSFSTHISEHPDHVHRGVPRAEEAPNSPSASPFAAFEERKPLSRLRQRIAQQMKRAQNEAAILTTFNEIDMQKVSELRAQKKDLFEKVHGARLGFMSFFVLAAIRALKRFPVINAEIRGTDIVFKNYAHIGVAVSTEKGLVVPVLHHAEAMDIPLIEKTILELAEKARTQKLMPQDLSHGSFTISNGGVFGSLLSTPLLNPPQSAILGLHAIQKRPVAIDNKIEIRPMMYVALSYDHRLIDGSDAVSFLKTIKENIENPENLILNL